MISIIVKLNEDQQVISRFIWSIEDCFSQKTTHEEVEVLFCGNQKYLDIDTYIPYRIYAAEEQGWRNLIALSQKAKGDIIIFSDIRILFTEDAFKTIISKFDPNTIMIPKIISHLDNRILDFGASVYNNKLIYLQRGLLYDSDLLSKEYEVISNSKLAVAISKQLFLNLCGKVDNFDSLYEVCIEKDIRIVADGNFIVYCNDSVQLPENYGGQSLSNTDLIFDVFSKNFLRLNKNFVAKEYLLVNISKDCLTKFVFSALVNVGVDIISTYNCFEITSAPNIDLFHILPLHFVNYHTAIIYYVESFKEIIENSLWFSARNMEFDLVVDSNMNVMHAFEIANNLI